jgi:hypothetical protein
MRSRLGSRALRCAPPAALAQAPVPRPVPSRSGRHRRGRAAHIGDCPAALLPELWGTVEPRRRHAVTASTESSKSFAIRPAPRPPGYTVRAPRNPVTRQLSDDRTQQLIYISEAEQRADSKSVYVRLWPSTCTVPQRAQKHDRKSSILGWKGREPNPRPQHYECCALTSLSYLITTGRARAGGESRPVRTVNFPLSVGECQRGQAAWQRRPLQRFGRYREPPGRRPES